MTTPLHTSIANQLVDIITHHVESLQAYISLQGAVDVPQPHCVLDKLEHLLTLTSCLPELADEEICETVYYLLAQFEKFLTEMNQNIDDLFLQTPLGEIWTHGHTWYKDALQLRAKPRISEVWYLLEPAIPDCLTELQDGTYIAKWWKPVPVMDIEIAQRTERIFVHGEPFEPQDLTDGIAIRFSVMG